MHSELRSEEFRHFLLIVCDTWNKQLTLTSCQLGPRYLMLMKISFPHRGTRKKILNKKVSRNPWLAAGKGKASQRQWGPRKPCQETSQEHRGQVPRRAREIAPTAVAAGPPQSLPIPWGSQRLIPSVFWFFSSYFWKKKIVYILSQHISKFYFCLFLITPCITITGQNLQSPCCNLRQISTYADVKIEKYAAKRDWSDA